MSKNKSGIKIGNVPGNIGNIINVGRDFQSIKSDYGKIDFAKDNPTAKELEALLTTMQKLIAEIREKVDVFTNIYNIAPRQMEQAEKNIKEVLKDVNKPDEINPEKAKSMLEKIQSVAEFLNKIFSTSQSITEHANEINDSLELAINLMKPLLKMLSVASRWITILWL